MPKEPNTSSFAIVIGLFAIIVVAILLTPRPHNDLYQMADQFDLQGPERASFIYLMSEARRESIAERFSEQPPAQFESIYDNQNQLLDELSQFLTPLQLELVEQQCIMPNTPSCQFPES